MNVSVFYDFADGQPRRYVATQPVVSQNVIGMLWQMLPRDW